MDSNEDDDHILAYRSGYEFVYSGNAPYSGKVVDGDWFLLGKANGNETQSDALNAALNQWIEALPEYLRARIERAMV
jgi:hypothetical protein